LAPKDARYLFDWLQPNLPVGWTSIRYWDLTEAPVAHVHNTRQRKDIFQERNVGPPNKNDETERLNKAIAKREADAAALAAAAETTPQPAPGAPGAPGLVPSTTVPLPTAVPIASPPGAQAPSPANPGSKPASTTSLSPGLQPTAASQITTTSTAMAR
jgi:hypothetical protein